MEIDADEPAVLPQPASDVDLVKPVPVYDLSLLVSNGVSSVHTGDTIAYTIVYTNTGNQLMSAVVLTNTLGGGLIYGSGSCGWTSSGGGRYLATIGTIAPGASSSCTMQAQASGPAPAIVTDTVRIGGAERDDNPADNAVTVSNFVGDPGVEYSDLYVASITTEPISPTVNSHTNFVVTVQNLGPGEAVDLSKTTGSVIGVFRLPGVQADVQSSATCSDYEGVIYVGLSIDPVQDPTQPDDDVTYEGFLRLPISKDSGALELRNQWWLGGENWGTLSHEFITPGWHRVVAQADIYVGQMDECGWSPVYGHLPELNETNNILAREVWVGESGSKNVALPFIVKGAK